MDPVDRTERHARLKELTDVLFRTRGFVPILLVTGAVGSVLAWMAQGQDLLRTVTDIGSDHTGFNGQVFWLCLSVVVLAFQAWFWAHVIVESEFGARERWPYKLYLTWTPRLLGLVPFALLFIALWRVSSATAWLAWVLGGLGLAFLITLWARLPLTRAMQRTSDHLQRTGNERAAAAIAVPLRNLRRIIFWFGVVYASITLALIAIDPVTLPVFFGPAAVVLTGCALLIPLLITLLLIGGRFHLRIGISLLLLIVVFSLWVDNHEIRLSSSNPELQRLAIASRPSLQEAYAKWRSQFPPSPARPIPLILVASEGGASRAGYWTAAVLSQFEMETRGEFSKHVFAISSISGGSLGVAGFLASIHDEKTKSEIAAGNTTLRKAVSDFVGRDYLSPALAGMLFPDLIQRFLPLSFLPDRSAALERGWEDGWIARCRAIPCDDQDLLKKDFLSLWPVEPSHGWLPAWFIGGALQEDGRPILTGNIRLGDTLDAWDFHLVAGRDVRLSTAILNGARFPYISSSGTLSNPAMPQAVGSVHIVDGGYFDAAGVETVRGLAQIMLAKGGPAADDAIQPIFLLISNDGINPPYSFETGARIVHTSVPIACRGQAVKSGCPGNDGGLTTVAPDLFGPVQGLYRSRSAHGERLKTLLYRYAPSQAEQKSETKVYTIDLCSMEVPMNWALSQNARRVVDDLLSARPVSEKRGCEQQNNKDFGELVKLLQP
jgi:hypothetical protein